MPSPLTPAPSTVRSVDSALGRWTHTTWRPAHLAPAVAELWLFEGRVALPRERTFPDGLVDLIVHLGPRYRAVRAGGGAAEHFPLACVAGVQTAPQVVEAPPDALRVLGVRLRPVGAHAVLGCPLPEIAAATIDLASVVGPEAAELAERCADAATADACLGRAGAWIAARLARADRRGAVHPAIAWAAAQIEGAHGAVSVTRLRADSGLGRTRFAEAFRSHVGLGAKRYARVLRFRRALGLLEAAAADGRAVDGRLTRIALDAGFYDHAHLAADFREFARLTPSAFAAARRYDGTPSLAEPA